MQKKRMGFTSSNNVIKIVYKTSVGKEQVCAADKFVNRHKGNTEGKRRGLTLLITLEQVQRIPSGTIHAELDEKVGRSGKGSIQNAVG